MDTCLHVVLSSKVQACGVLGFGGDPTVRRPSWVLGRVASAPALIPVVSVPGQACWLEEPAVNIGTGDGLTLLLREGLGCIWVLPHPASHQVCRGYLVKIRQDQVSGRSAGLSFDRLKRTFPITWVSS